MRIDCVGSTLTSFTCPLLIRKASLPCVCQVTGGQAVSVARVIAFTSSLLVHGVYSPEIAANMLVFMLENVLFIKNYILDTPSW